MIDKSIWTDLMNGLSVSVHNIYTYKQHYLDIVAVFVVITRIQFIYQVETNSFTFIFTHHFLFIMNSWYRFIFSLYNIYFLPNSFNSVSRFFFSRCHLSCLYFIFISISIGLRCLSFSLCHSSNEHIEKSLSPFIFVYAYGKDYGYNLWCVTIYNLKH